MAHVVSLGRKVKCKFTQNRVTVVVVVVNLHVLFLLLTYMYSFVVNLHLLLSSVVNHVNLCAVINMLDIGPVQCTPVAGVGG